MGNLFSVVEPPNNELAVSNASELQEAGEQVEESLQERFTNAPAPPRF